MSYDLNKVMLIGRAGKDPETRFTNNRVPVTSFSLATTSRWRDSQTQETHEETEWHNIVCFGRLAEIASEYLKKGQQCFIEGQLRTQSWERDGVRHYKTDVRAKELILLGGGEGGSGQREGGYSRSTTKSGTDSRKRQENAPQSKIEDQSKELSADELDDDIPF
ncbi:MAG: single-stranded DNA-binding protein [Gammaproteobacteria bacterium]|nr:single-stranded DNA-binding protein [Gammaproteobacteria bacterium]MYF02982.1 single-stranded DNA-binding protein [Gammaproteobacteria bacterium]MYI77076.1 single-stranded DNA-binding protein [Gammaproteobacteria bacterium]